MARNRYDIDENLESPFDIKHLKRLGKYIKKYLKNIILALLLSIISSITVTIIPMLIGLTIDSAIPNKDVNQLVFFSIVLLVIIILSVLFSTYRLRIMAKVGQEIIYDIRKDLFEHMQKLSFEYYDNRPHGKILTRVIHYVNNISDSVTNGLINFILEIFNLVFIVIFMFMTDVRLTFVILSGLPILLTVIFILMPIQRKAWQTVSNKMSNMNAYIHESVDGVKINQVFDRQEQNNEIFNRLNNNFKKSWMKAQYSSNLLTFFVENISIFVLSLLYVVGVLFYNGVVSFGVIVAMASYSWSFWQPILNLSNLYNNFVNAISYLERIFETLDEPVIVSDNLNATKMPTISGSVIFDNVTFGYEENNKVLKNVSFSVKKGESVALVGPTGAGKSTIVNLISRFYDLDSGKILIDGIDISKVTLNSLRSQMGIMLQDSFIFSGSVYDNIKYGNLNATYEMVKKSCEIVCANEFIEELENGYYTIVGEKGVRFSSGQRQLISLARTLISDPKILILDEATSTIDVKTEKLLQKGILEILKGRTCFIIAHRLSTIRNCDKIMYISNFGITECGTHEELMEKKGDYYNLYIKQSL